MNPNAYFGNNPADAAASGYQSSPPPNHGQSAPTMADLQNDALVSSQGSLHVDVLALQGIHSQLSAYVAGLFDTSLPQLSRIVHVLDSTWAGTNHTRFMTYFDERVETVKLHKKVLEDYLDALSQAIAVYKRLETDIESRVSTMSNLIDSNTYYGDNYGNYS